MKYENEVTVELDACLDSLQLILNKSGFEIKEEYDLDDIYMINRFDKDSKNTLELLKKCVLVRNVIEQNENKKMLTYKYKEYNDNKDIVKQGKIDCVIDNIEKAILLFEHLNFEKLIEIHDHLIVYSNNIDEFAVQCVNGKHIYIEIEEKCNYIEKRYKTIDEMIEVIKKYNLPIKSENYFVKKAEIELLESLNKNN